MLHSETYEGESALQPAVSIIIPTYNRLRFLREAVQSVLDQTTHDWELIVVDDGSTDESLEWLESLDEPRLSILRERHTGNRSALRNLGVRRARTPWIAFLDSDDRWHPEKLERQLALHRDNPRFRWSYTGYRLIDAAGNELTIPAHKPWRARSGWIQEPDLLLEANVALPSVVVDRELFRKTGGFDETFLYAEDQDLWFRLAKQAECGVVDAPLLDIRLHKDPSIPDPDLCLGFERLYRTLADRTSDPGFRELARTRQAYKAVDAAGMFATLRQWPDAKAALSIAFRVRPLGPFVHKAALRLLWRRVQAGLRQEASPAPPPRTDETPPPATQRDR